MTFNKVNFNVGGIGDWAITQVITGTYVIGASSLSPNERYFVASMGYDSREGRRFERYPRSSDLVTELYLFDMEADGLARKWSPGRQIFNIRWDLESNSFFYASRDAIHRHFLDAFSTEVFFTSPNLVSSYEILLGEDSLIFVEQVIDSPAYMSKYDLSTGEFKELGENRNFFFNQFATSGRKVRLSQTEEGGG